MSSAPISIGEKECQVLPHNEEAISPTFEKTCEVECSSHAGDAVFVKGEPVIATGRDVSLYLVDERDDGDPALTFRSLLIGTVFACLGAALCQIYEFKPVQVSVSTVFLLLLIYSWGLAWAKFIPRRSSVEGTRFEKLGPILEFLNPSEFKIKEHVIATLVASTAASGNTAVLNFAVQRLYYNTDVKAITAVLATFSTSCFGYGLCGLLRPLTVYPSEMVYWMNLPTVTIFQSLHFDTAANHKRMRLFWLAFAGMFIWEIIPSYIFPLLNGISIFCLASQHAKPSIQDIFTNIFGGIDGNEGLGLLSISLDWQYITSQSAYLTSHALPANTWIGTALCYIIISVIYYSNVWNSLTFPMLSTSIFSSNGSIYDQSTVFGSAFQLNQTALEEVGLPHMTGSNVWLNITANLSIGGLLAHCLCFWGPYLRDTLRNRHSETRSDPHWKAMHKYDEAPFWWYIGLLILAFFSGLIVIIKGQTTLPWYSYIVALLLGSFVTPFSQLLYARMGSGVATNQLMKMVGGAITPGRPVANLYFSMWSHDIIQQSISLAADLKIGQYLKIPPRVMFLTQVWGTILGAAINYVVMVSVVNAQRSILVNPNGNNIWSGQLVQSLNSDAVTWSLAKDLYGPGGPYFIVPMSLLIGTVPTIIQWLIAKRWPTIGPVKVDSIILPIIYMCSAVLSSGTNSTITSTILVGFISQFWLRKYHPGWFRKYNYILGGALDGGAQVMIFILSFAVFGASGVPRPFLAWAGNPVKGNVDYCNGNGAL
ncbi:OPT oligopeptide transporter protein-domain-containing protein, partial [Pisolithus marmoratus]